MYRKLLESGKLNKNKIEELLSWKNDENPAEQPPETVDKIVTDENTVETKAINAEANGVDKKLTGLADRMKAIKEDNALMQKSEVEDEPEDKLSALRDRISAVKSNGNNVGLSNEEDESIQDDDKPNVDKILERIMKTQSESVIETPEEEAQVRTDLALTSAYNEVSREIMRMVDFFRTRKFDTHVTEIVLLGGGSNMNGFREHMENTADINTNLIGNIEENIEIDVVDYQLLVPSIGAILGG